MRLCVTTLLGVLRDVGQTFGERIYRRVKRYALCLVTALGTLQYCVQITDLLLSLTCVDVPDKRPMSRR